MSRVQMLGSGSTNDGSTGSSTRPSSTGHERACTSQASAPIGGEQAGPNPTDRGKAGSKHLLVVDRNGITLAVRLSTANAHDATQLLPLVEASPPIIGPRGRLGRPCKRPA